MGMLLQSNMHDKELNYMLLLTLILGLKWLE